jgi:hypothetical protein
MATAPGAWRSLPASDIDDLFGLPRFTEEDRQRYFDLSPVEQALSMAFNFRVAAHFVLQLGYLKAKQQFFVYEPGAVFDDLRHIVERYFPDRALAQSTMLSKSSRRT